MLTKHELELITAAVDGELTGEESRAFAQLAARSPEATELHAALVAVRESLRILPRVVAPRDLATSIFAAIQNQTPTVPVLRPSRSRSRWIPAALAASLLVAVSSGTYWFVSGNAAPRMARKQYQQLPKDTIEFVPNSTIAVGSNPSNDPAVPAPAPSAIEPPMPAPSTVASNANPDPTTTPNVPELDPSRILTAPVGSDVKAFDRVEIKLPLLAPLTDLGNEEVQGALRKNLARDPATRIDLFAKDTAKAAEALMAAGRKSNVNVLVESVASERMKRKMPSAWWVTTDALTPDEIAAWLIETAAVEAAASSSEKTFGNLHAVAAGPLEQKDSLALAGVDLGLGKKPTAGSANAHISAKTIDQVAGALQKTEAPKPALLLTYLPPLVRVHPLLSKDIKQFHELRKDRKPGTVPLVIVIRPIG